jgi:ABC-type nitrate/sulfonate/bicarbonate transport system substrate-binding protein
MCNGKQNRLRFIVTLIHFLMGCPSAFAQSDTVRVVYYPPWNISKLPLYFARDTDIFERNGLKLSWTNPGSNEKLLAAMKNGGGDIFVVSSNHVVQNNATGGPALTLVANSGYNYSVLLVDSAITRPEDLRGKKVGTGEPGSTPDRLTRLALRKLGLDPDRDVTLVHSNDARSADRATALSSGQLSGTLVTAEAMYDLEKTGQIKNFRILADHTRLNIYAGGGADYAMAVAFLKTRREEAKGFMSGICEGIAGAKQNRLKALEIMTKSERGRDPAALEYLYRLYTTEVIPARPYPKIEGVELGIEMVASTLPAARGMKAQELVDATLVEELVKEGHCN